MHRNSFFHHDTPEHINHNQLNRDLANKFLDRVISHIKKKSDPNIMQKILTDLKLDLDSFEPRDNEFNNFRDKILKESINLEPLIEGFKTGILNHIPIYTLLAFIENENLVTDEELENLSEQLQIELNFLCLFEALSVTMSNSVTFTEDIYSFIVKQRNVSYPGNPINNLFMGSDWSKVTIFKSLKMISIDPGITAGAFVRSLDGKWDDKVEALAKQFIKKHGLKLWNSPIQPYSPGETREASVKNVIINILEALWEDLVKGKPNKNTCAGAALIAILEYLRPKNFNDIENLILRDGVSSLINNEQYDLLPDLIVNSNPKIISKFEISKEWMDLYTSWNLLFLSRHLEGKFLPIKLLTPSIINAIPNQYMEARVFMLFLIGNFFHKNDVSVFSSNVEIKNLDVIFSKWAEINNDYANEILKTHCPDLKKTSETICNDIFGEYPNIAFAMHLFNFVRDFDHFQILPKLGPSKEEDISFQEKGNITSCCNIL